MMFNLRICWVFLSKLMHKTCNESRTSSIYMLIVQCESDVNRLLTFKNQTTFDFEFYIRGSYRPTYRQIAWECDKNDKSSALLDPERRCNFAINTRHAKTEERERKKKMKCYNITYIFLP